MRDSEVRLCYVEFQGGGQLDRDDAGHNFGERGHLSYFFGLLAKKNFALSRIKDDVRLTRIVGVIVRVRRVVVIYEGMAAGNGVRSVPEGSHGRGHLRLVHEVVDTGLVADWRTRGRCAVQLES